MNCRHTTFLNNSFLAQLCYTASRDFRVKIYTYFQYSPKFGLTSDRIELVINMTCMTKEELGENLRVLRVKRGIKQETLARDLHIRRQTISSYERGSSMPDIYILMEIADIFDVSLDMIVDRKFEKPDILKE